MIKRLLTLSFLFGGGGKITSAQLANEPENDSTIYCQAQPKPSPAGAEIALDKYI